MNSGGVAIPPPCHAGDCLPLRGTGRALAGARNDTTVRFPFQTVVLSSYPPVTFSFNLAGGLAHGLGAARAGDRLPNHDSGPTCGSPARRTGRGSFATRCRGRQFSHRLTHRRRKASPKGKAGRGKPGLARESFGGYNMTKIAAAALLTPCTSHPGTILPDFSLSHPVINPATNGDNTASGHNRTSIVNTRRWGKVKIAACIALATHSFCRRPNQPAMSPRKNNSSPSPVSIIPKINTARILVAVNLSPANRLIAISCSFFILSGMVYHTTPEKATPTKEKTTAHQ